MSEKILISILLALVYQSHGSKKNPALAVKANEALSLIRLPERVLTPGDINSLFITIKEIVDRLLVEGTSTPVDISRIESELKSCRIFFKNECDSIIEELRALEAMDLEAITENYIRYHGILNEWVNSEMIRKITGQFAFKIREEANKFKLDGLISEMREALVPYQGSGRNDQLSHIVGLNSVVGLDQAEELTDVYQAAEDTYGEVGGLKLDLQGWNIAFGPDALIPRGVFIEVQALSGRSKSETLRRICTAICRQNNPQLIDEKRKPMVLYITLEDTQQESWLKIFNQIWCEENDALPPDWTADEKTAYVKSRLEVNGIHFQIAHLQKNVSRPEDVIALQEYYQESGYELLSTAIDYVGLLNHNHLPAELEPNKIQLKHSMLGEFGKRNHILTWGANQLGNVRAEELLETADEFAKEAAAKNINVGSNRILDELDARVVVHVAEGDDGFWYHQFSVGKLRWAKGYPRNLRHAVYRLHSVDNRAAGFIVPDIGGECLVRDTTAGPLRSEGGGAW